MFYLNITLSLSSHLFVFPFQTLQSFLIKYFMALPFYDVYVCTRVLCTCMVYLLGFLFVFPYTILSQGTFFLCSLINLQLGDLKHVCYSILCCLHEGLPPKVSSYWFHMPWVTQEVLT